MPHYDVIVVGLGAHGSATLYQLAKRGVSALGIDRFDPPHSMGSTHGETRGLYEAAAHGTAHVPFARRTIELWRELERESGVELYTQDGILIMDNGENDMFRSTVEVASDTGSEFEEMDARTIHARFPALKPEDQVVGVFQPKGGVIRVEPTIRAQLKLAAERGATVRTNEPVTSWTADGSGVEVVTSRDTYRGDKVVFSSGAFLPGLVTDLPVQLDPWRQVVTWWKPKAQPENFTPDRLPVWMLANTTPEIPYGFPDIGSGVKVGVQFDGPVIDPETVDRTVTEADIEPMRDLWQRIQPDVMGEYLRGLVCLYTCTPDMEFIVDEHPNHPNVIIACICNGGGFMYSAAFGETLSQLAVDGRTKLDISAWTIDRFATAS
jgi:monomeric sarcosine oxidase